MQDPEIPGMEKVYFHGKILSRMTGNQEFHSRILRNVSSASLTRQ